MLMDRSHREIIRRFGVVFKNRNWPRKSTPDKASGFRLFDVIRR